VWPVPMTPIFMFDSTGGSLCCSRTYGWPSKSTSPPKDGQHTERHAFGGLGYRCEDLQWQLVWAAAAIEALGMLEGK
jgi:hypothetical protein